MVAIGPLRTHYLVRPAAALFAVVVLSACVSGQPAGDGQHPRVRTYVGLVTIAPPSGDAPESVVDLTTLGAWIGAGGAGVGYLKELNVELTEDCRIVFVIRNIEDLEAAIALVNSTLEQGEDEVCVV